MHILILLGFVQILQYYYQRGCLYRLKTLGETDKMVVTGGKNDLLYFESTELI